MSQDQKNGLLNPHQKNSLKVTLRMFEENLRSTLRWLDGYEEDGILYSYRLDISGQDREQARQEINTALDLVENLSRRFGLPKESINSASMIRGDLTISWADLYDTRAKKLARYGKVHPQLVNNLDSDIQKLADIAQQLSAIIGKS
jgi:hypothetical protein